MKNKPHFFFLLLSTFAALTGAKAEASVLPMSSAPVMIFIARHAEKSAVSGDVPLSVEGQARAAVLATTLEHAGVSVVFSSELTFARETAAVLAQRRKLEPKVIPVRETEKLLVELNKLSPGTVALVVGHSSSIPTLVEKLAGHRPSPIEEFDRLFVVSRPLNGTATVAELRYGLPR